MKLKKLKEKIKTKPEKINGKDLLSFIGKEVYVSIDGRYVKVPIVGIGIYFVENEWRITIYPEYEDRERRLHSLPSIFCFDTKKELKEYEEECRKKELNEQ